MSAPNVAWRHSARVFCVERRRSGVNARWQATSSSTRIADGAPYLRVSRRLSAARQARGVTRWHQCAARISRSASARSRAALNDGTREICTLIVPRGAYRVLSHQALRASCAATARMAA